MDFFDKLEEEVSLEEVSNLVGVFCKVKINKIPNEREKKQGRLTFNFSWVQCS